MIAAILLLAASQAFPVGQVESWKRANPKQRRAVVKQITTECKLPPSALKVRRGGAIVMQPSPDTPYEAVECMLEKVKVQIGFSKVAFIGNEALAEEKK